MKKQKAAVVRLRNCHILRDSRIIKEDLWIRHGRIIDPEVLFFEEQRPADVNIDCPFLLAPGFIDLQINGNAESLTSNCCTVQLE